MRTATMIRALTIPSLLTLALVLSASPAYAQKGGGGGGGGGTSNPFVGKWGGDLPSPFNPELQYTFTFNKDFTFTLIEDDTITGVVTTWTGTYQLGGIGPDGLPLLTMFSGGAILLEEEYSPSGGAFVLRGTLFIVIGKI